MDSKFLLPTIRISGISSLQYIFSKIFVDMNDVYITSSHGKIPDFDYILSHKKVCMVTDNKIGPHEICKEIQKRNLNKIVVVGENLSYDNERITVGKAEEILAVEKFDMNEMALTSSLVIGTFPLINSSFFI